MAGLKLTLGMGHFSTLISDFEFVVFTKSFRNVKRSLFKMLVVSNL